VLCRIAHGGRKEKERKKKVVFIGIDSTFVDKYLLMAALGDGGRAWSGAAERCCVQKRYGARCHRVVWVLYGCFVVGGTVPVGAAGFGCLG